MGPMNAASPHPVAVFRWEDSSALEHSCWACPTKSNSPKALHSCYGIHSIPCIAYHSTMHAIGTSHRCSGCVMSREIHDNRHREIAELVAQYNAADSILSPAPARRHALSERPANIGLRDLAQVDEQDADDSMSDLDQADENDSVFDAASTATSSDGSCLKLTKAEQRERKKAAKLQKSRSKAAKNEARYAAHVTSEDVKKVERVLHGENDPDQEAQRHPLATDKTIEDVIARNLGFVKQIQSHKQALYDSVRTGRQEDQQRKKIRKRVSEGFEDVETEAIVDAVLVKLGVHLVSEQDSKKGKSFAKSKSGRPTPDHKKTPANPKSKIVFRLREAIKEDLEKHENDLRQTYIRAGGFFRYAGKAVFERMTEIAKNIDLQTGEEWEKKRKREGNNRSVE